MQYDSIILELLTRIQNLEDDVSALKAAQASQMAASMQETSAPAKEDADKAVVRYGKMDDKMIDLCYQCGKKVAQGENPQALAEDIALETGMNRNSAVMYLYAVSGMLAGTVYKRSISATAMQTFFDRIFNEYGSEGLKKALRAAKLHIEYRRQCGHQVDSIEKICDRYEHRL